MITNDIQKLEVDGKIELFELDLTEFGADYLRFHSYTQIGPIWWQGLEYSAHPLEATGFELTTEGTQPSPTLNVSNIMQQGDNLVIGVISALCIRFDGLVGAKVTRRVTLKKYLDAQNFVEGNPSADPTQHLPDSVWYIEQKTRETAETIEFKLASPLDLNGQQLPNRQILAGICNNLILDRDCGGGYRGAYCAYTGTNMFDREGNPVSDPTLDKCGGRPTDCKLRFGEYETINFSGFPSADTLR